MNKPLAGDALDNAIKLAKMRRDQPYLFVTDERDPSLEAYGQDASIGS